MSEFSLDSPAQLQLSCFFFSSYLPPPDPPRCTYWSVLRKFRYQGSVGYGLISTTACIHLPRRKETIEIFLEVASRPDPGIEAVTSRSRQRQHGYARLHAKRRLLS